MKHIKCTSRTENKCHKVHFYLTLISTYTNAAYKVRGQTKNDFLSYIHYMLYFIFNLLYEKFVLINIKYFCVKMYIEILRMPDYFAD